MVKMACSMGASSHQLLLVADMVEDLVMSLSLLLLLAVLAVGGCNSDRVDCQLYARVLMANPEVPPEYHDAITAIWRHCTEPVGK